MSWACTSLGGRVAGADAAAGSSAARRGDALEGRTCLWAAWVFVKWGVSFSAIQSNCTMWRNSPELGTFCCLVSEDKFHQQTWSLVLLLRCYAPVRRVWFCCWFCCTQCAGEWANWVALVEALVLESKMTQCKSCCCFGCSVDSELFINNVY